MCNLNFYGCHWLNRFTSSEINKLEQLQIANNIGLKTPYTFLKTRLNEQDFNTSIITKPMSDGLGINIKDSLYRTYTSKVEKRNTDIFCFVGLFQEEIEKKLELRVFYLDNRCHAIAILSQTDIQTAVDYRNYNYNHPNRLEYYTLPKKIAKKIELLMEYFNLQTGSLDFILDKQGNYVFLEVNPSGQYGLFDSCNIYPNKLIAEYLLKKHYEYPRKNRRQNAIDV